MKWDKNLIKYGLLTLVLSACSAGITTTSSNTDDTDDDTTTTTTATVPDGAKAARFLFRAASTGSFDTPTGTTATATRVFTPGNVQLASGTTSSDWPSWIKGLTLGISGDCARFTSSSGESASCDLDNDSSLDDACGTSETDIYRISEYDCGSVSLGNGTSADGVFIRAEFDRTTTVLGETENIMVVLEYTAAGLNPAPTDPTVCFTSGVFTPENSNCSDMAWKVYLTSDLSATVQPFLMLVPPIVTTGATTGGVGISTKQFILPMAADTSLKYMQISRIKGTQDSTNCAANSPNCIGMIFYAITFYRI